MDVIDQIFSGVLRLFYTVTSLAISVWIFIIPYSFAFLDRFKPFAFIYNLLLPSLFSIALISGLFSVILCPHDEKNEDSTSFLSLRNLVAYSRADCFNCRAHGPMIDVSVCASNGMAFLTSSIFSYLAQSAIVLAVNAQASLSRVSGNNIAKEIYGSEVLLPS
ncbi:hypothetical protein ACTFIW_003846 [Dictyostelium discoideum]